MSSTPGTQTAPSAGPPVAVPPVPPLAPERRRRFLPGKTSPLKLAIITPLLLVASAIFLYPFLWAVSASLKPREEVFDNALIPHHWHWINYKWVFTGVPDIAAGAPFGRWFLNSMYIGVAGALAVTVSSALVAFAFAYFRFPLRNLLFAFVLGSMMLPGAVTMIPTYLIWHKIGLVGTMYPLWLGNLFGSAFYIFLMRQFFLGIPRDLFEAARIDGDNYWTMFWRIAAPLAKPAMIVTFIFEFKAKWTDLLTPLIYLQNDSQFTIPRGLYALLGIYGPSGGGHGDYQVIIAATVIATVPMIIIFFLGQRYFLEGIATQGRKG